MRNTLKHYENKFRLGLRYRVSHFLFCHTYRIPDTLTTLTNCEGCVKGVKDVKRRSFFNHSPKSTVKQSVTDREECEGCEEEKTKLYHRTIYLIPLCLSGEPTFILHTLSFSKSS